MHCIICLGTPQDPVTMECCKHKYCLGCLNKWKEVRNVCPLCCAPTGEEDINKLKKIESSEQFDDGSLILQTQIGQIKVRVTQVEQRILNKRQQYKKLKNTIPSSLMSYFDKQLQRVQIYRDCMDEQFLLFNRASTVKYMQLIAQAILQLENALCTNTIQGSQLYDYDEYDDEYNDYYFQEDYCDDDQYQDYEVNYSKRQPKTKKSKNNQAQDQKNKTTKLN